VQRVPVRIALDPREIAAHPLQIGLSMKAEIDVKGGDNAARLPQVASNPSGWSTSAAGTSERQADERVQAIIAANQSTPGAAQPVHAASASAAGGELPASRLAVNMPLPGSARRLH
jgi:membrane fusion protein (multidrug efflux system)